MHADNMQRRGYREACGRIRVTNLNKLTVDELLYLLVFVWSSRSESTGSKQQKKCWNVANNKLSRSATNGPHA